MISFNSLLEKLVNGSSEIYGASIVGFDGINFARFYKSEGLPVSADVFEAYISEFSFLIKKFVDINNDFNLGSTRELNINSEQCGVLFKILNSKYFLAILCSPKAFIGQVNYYSSLELSKIKEALSV